MPVVQRQSPVSKPAANGPAKAASVLDRIEPINFADDGLKALIYGRSGSGKTTLSGTFPGPILWIVCSGGQNPGELRSLDSPEIRKKIQQVRLRDSGEIKELAQHVSVSGKYRTVVLDHASGFADLVIMELLGLREIPIAKYRAAGKGESWSTVSQQQYGQLAVMCKEYFRSLLNLPTNVIVVAQERVFGGKEDGGSPEIIRPTVGPALTPSIVGWLAPACDYILQTFIRPKMEKVTVEIAGKPSVMNKPGKGVEFCARTEVHDTFLTKIRAPRGVVLPDAIVDPTYEKILAVIRGQYKPPKT